MFNSQVCKVENMRSTLKTTAAVLRMVTGEKDSVWAEDILGKSVHTIRHLEAGTLKLSADLAAKMNYESGISIKWLMDGDPTAPPVTADDRPFTKEIYDNVQARKKYFATVRPLDVKNTVLDVLRAICAILVSANRKQNFHLAVYRTAKALAELRDEFGEAADFNTINKAEDYVRDAPRWRAGVDVFEPPPEHLREGLRKIEQLIRRDYPIDGKQDRASKTASRKAAVKPKSKRPLKKRRR
jgi:hypothetical protein